MHKCSFILATVVMLSILTSCNNSYSADKNSNVAISNSSATGTSSTNTFVTENSSTNIESSTVPTNSVTVQSTPGGVRQYKYKFDDEDFVDVEEFIKWINETDPVAYKDGQFRTMLEPIIEDGYIYVPYYKNKKFTLASTDEYVVTTRFEMDYEGHGYSYLYKDEEGALLTVHLYYLEKDEAKDANNNLWNYVNGKGAKDYYKTWEECQKQGWNQVNNHAIDGTVIKFGDSRIFYSFLYKNEIIVKITSHEGNSLPFEEFVKDLKFEKVKLN